MDFSANQIAIAIFIKEALSQTDSIEWNKGLCHYVHSYIEKNEPVLVASQNYIRFLEIFHDAVYSWKDYSGNPCYPIWLKSHNGTPRLQWDTVFVKSGSPSLQVNYEAKRKQLAQHIVVTLKDKYHV